MQVVSDNQPMLEIGLVGYSSIKMEIETRVAEIGRFGPAQADYTARIIPSLRLILFKMNGK